MNLIKPSFSTGYAKNASESANPNLWKGLVGAWMPSFGVTGGTLKDVSGNGNDGVFHRLDPSQSWVTKSGRIGIDFISYGSDYDYYIESPYSKSLDIEGNAFAVVAEVESDTLAHSSHGDGVIVFGKTGINDGQYEVLIVPYNSANYIFFRMRTSGGTYFYYPRLSPLELNKKNHIACLFSEGVMRIFVNGQEEGTGSSVAYPIVSYGNKLWFGRRPAHTTNTTTDSSLDGKIYSASIYNRALSPSEIKQLYLNPSAPFLRKQQTVGLSTAQAFNPYWANQATQLAGTLQ